MAWKKIRWESSTGSPGLFRDCRIGRSRHLSRWFRAQNDRAMRPWYAFCGGTPVRQKLPSAISDTDNPLRKYFEANKEGPGIYKGYIILRYITDIYKNLLDQIFI